MEFILEKLNSIEIKLNYKIVLLIIVVFGLLVYGNTLINGMFWDDYDSVINNQYIRSWENLPKYFTENLTSGAGIKDNYWRPLLLLSFSIDYKIGKLEPFFYHFQNLFWHLAASFLVFLLIYKLLKNNLAGLIGALLFLVHPLQVEAVTYVAGRADPLHLALMLGSLLLFIGYAKEEKSKKYLIFSLVLFAAALLAKERAIVFPGFVILYLVTFYDGKIIGNWKRKLILISPYIAVAALYTILRMTVLHFTDTFDLGAENNIGAENLAGKIFAYLKGLAIYAGLIIWPARLYMEKSISIPKSFFDPFVLVGSVTLIISIVAIFISFRKKKILAFGLLWFYGAILPSLHVFPIQGLLYEHWLYPALPGLFLILGYFLSRLVGMTQPNRLLRIISIFFLLLILTGLGVRTMLRNADWENPVRFYEKNVALGGKSARVLTNLGMAYDEIKEHEKAIASYREAIALDDRLFQPWHDMGVTYGQMGKTDEALDAYSHALERNPIFMPSMINSAVVYYKLGDKNNSKLFFEKALEIDPRNSEIKKAIESLK